MLFGSLTQLTEADDSPEGAQASGVLFLQLCSYLLSNILPMDPRSHFWRQMFLCVLVILIRAEGNINREFPGLKPDKAGAGDSFQALTG